MNAGVLDVKVTFSCKKHILFSCKKNIMFSCKKSCFYAKDMFFFMYSCLALNYETQWQSKSDIMDQVVGVNMYYVPLSTLTATTVGFELEMSGLRSVAMALYTDPYAPVPSFSCNCSLEKSTSLSKRR